MTRQKRADTRGRRVPTSQEREYLATFLGWIGDTPKLWKSVDLRIVAAKIDSRWYFIGGSCWLRHETVSRVSRVSGLPNNSRIWAFQHVAPLAQLRPILTRILQGSLIHRGRRVSFLAPPKLGATGEPRPVEFIFRPVSATQRAPNLIRPPFVYAHTSQLGGETGGYYLPDGRIDALNDHLRGLTSPWDGFADLLRQGLNSGYSVEHTSAVTLDVVAPIGLALAGERCRLANGSLHVNVLAESPAVRRFASVSYALDGPSGRTTGVHHAKVADWMNDGRLSSLGFTTDAGDARTATVFLRFNKSPMAQMSLAESTQRQGRLEAAHQVFAKDTAEWERVLLESDGETSGSGDGREFEKAAARLFTFLGFAVSEIGHTKGDQPDFLATAPGYPLLVVECTTGSLRSKTKLGNLVRRSADVRDAIRLTNHLPALPHLPSSPSPNHPHWRQCEVTPLIISSLPSTRVSEGERAEAGRDDVAVLDRGDLTHLLSLARRGETVGTVSEYLASRISRP